MKQNPDSYLLYEAGKFITYNFRLKFVMRQKVDAKALEMAANTAFKRFPYYAKRISILKNGEIELVDNPLPITVKQYSGKHPRMGTEEVNYHLFSIEYEGNDVYFNIYHGMCGGCGAMFFIKSTLWYYVREAFGVETEIGDIKTADTPFVDGETDYPDLETLTDDEPLGSIKKDSVYIPAADYVKQLVSMPFRDAKYYELELETKDFMKYARSNDGSPNSILSALMFRAICKVTSPKVAKAIRGNIICNYRADVGCPNTYHDLVRMLSVYYPRELESKTTEYLSTVTRSMMYVQMQPEFSSKIMKSIYKSMDDVDNKKGLLNKKLFTLTHSQHVQPPFGTFIVSYVGKDEWYGLEEYIDRIHCITDGHLLLEVNALRDKFYLTFMELNGKHKFYDAFCEAMREENIHFKGLGSHERNLPYTILPKKSKGKV